MSNQPTPSMGPPAGIPASSGNGKYIVVVVLLIAAVAALLAWRSCGGQGQPQTAVLKFDAGPPSSHDDDNVPPPPPPDEPAASASAAVRPGVFNPCDVKSCTNGKSSDELETALGFRAKQAHRCYDQALAQDGDLKGHVTISVRVASNGTLCAANVAANDMGSDAVANCVANVFRASRSFPAPKSGCVDAKIPISFVPGGK
jgi:hypothetical protein